MFTLELTIWPGANISSLESISAFIQRMAFIRISQWLIRRLFFPTKIRVALSLEGSVVSLILIVSIELQFYRK